MSLLSLSRALALPKAGLAMLPVCCLVLSTANASDAYFLPAASVGSEYDSNRNMSPDPSNAKSVEGYSAGVEAILGLRTPRSSSELRPRIRYQVFPSDQQFNRTEGWLNLKSKVDTERSEFIVLGEYSRQDIFTYNFIDVGFDPFNPNPPPTSNNGNFRVNETRTLAELRPSYTYRWNATTGVGVDFLVQDMTYSADVPLHTQDYDNGQGSLKLMRHVSALTELSVGGLVGRFKTKDGLNKTDSVGALADLSHHWSKEDSSTLSLVVERNRAEFQEPVPNEETATNWGAQFSTLLHGEVSELRFIIGRELIPSGAGGIEARNGIRAQYDRNLSQRLTFTSALNGYRQRVLFGQSSVSSANRDRDVAVAEFSLHWAVTPTWFLSGGYGYSWQDVMSKTGAAHNDRVFVAFVYQALSLTRRNWL
jgi:hypothetical protein